MERWCRGYQLIVSLFIFFAGLGLVSCEKTGSGKSAANVALSSGGDAEHYQECRVNIDEISETLGVGDPMFGGPLEELLLVDAFVEIMESPDRYRQCTYELLADTDEPWELKNIALHSMVNLDVDVYLQFAARVYELLKAGTIDEDLFLGIFFSDFLEPPLVKHYRKPNVREFLITVRDEDAISTSSKQSLQAVLDGETWRNEDRLFYRYFWFIYYVW